MANLNERVQIREVWRDNIDDEFKLIREVVEQYPYVAMDTEFPGMVVRPVGNPWDFNYQSLKSNVARTNLIQLGLTFSNQNGALPTCETDKFCVWQFNFCEFNPNQDNCNKESIDLLIRSGINFQKNQEDGVSTYRFVELLMSSGVVLTDEVQWITFHSAYDFGYLVKLLTGRDLPDTEQEFLGLIKVFFPNFYDTKYVIKFCDGLHGGLSKLASILNVTRIGTSHQAGSDSFVTMCVFFKVISIFFNNALPEKYKDVLFGVGVGNVQHNSLKKT